MRAISTCFFAVLLTLSAPAQQKTYTGGADATNSAAAPALPADAPSKEQLIRLFDVMELQKQMAGMMAAVGNNMEKMLPANVNFSEKQKAGLVKLQSDLLTNMMSPEFVDTYIATLIPIYQRHFTKAEVDDLISFYASAVGQKFLHEQPRLTQESFATVMPLMQKRVQEVMDQIKYEQRLREIAGEEEPAAPKK